MSIEPKKPLSLVEQMPVEIQTLVMKCLNAQEMGTSVAAIAVFRKLMEKNETWLQVAQKLNIEIVNPTNAKKEFLEHYAYTKAVNDVLMNAISDEITTTKDPFALREILKKYIFEHRNDELLIIATQNLLDLIALGDSPTEPTDAMVDATALLLRLGVKEDDDLSMWVKDHVRPAAEIYPEILRSSLGIESQLLRDGILGSEFLLLWAIRENQDENAKVVLEEGYMPSNENLPSVLDWAVAKLTSNPDDEHALIQICDHTDEVISQLQKDGKPVNELQQKVKLLRAK